MSNQSSRKNKSASPLGTKFIVAALVLTGVLGVVVFLNYSKWLPVPDPPGISLTDLDPAIVAVVRNAQEAVIQNPRSDKAWGELGQVYMIYEYNESAIECFDQAERLNPQEPRWPYFNGILHYPEEVEVCLKKMERSVALFNDESFGPRLRLATIYADLGRFDDAATHYQRVLDREPDSAVALFGKGRIANAQGQFEESARLLEQSAKSPFAAQQSSKLLSTIYLRLGDEEASRTASERVDELPPDANPPDPFVEEASRFKTGQRAWTDRAQQLVRRNQFAEALPLVQQTLTNYPESDEAWQLLGKIRLSQRDYSGAEVALRNAVRLGPESVESHAQLGVALLFQNKTEAAVESLRTALRYKADVAEVHYNLGLAYGNLGDFDASIESFRNAFRYKPSFMEAYLGAASVYFERDQLSEARQILDRAKQINPEDPRLLQMQEKLASQL